MFLNAQEVIERIVDSATGSEADFTDIEDLESQLSSSEGKNNKKKNAKNCGRAGAILIYYCMRCKLIMQEESAHTCVCFSNMYIV